MMRTDVPQGISKCIRELCRDIVPDERPRFVSVAPAPNAAPNECFPAVEGMVAANGGSVIHGWQIWEWPGYFVEAEFHAIWAQPNGVWVDVTPKIPPVARILFLPDPTRQYEGRQVNNVRRAIVPLNEVLAMIAAAEEEYALLNRGDREDEHGEIHLVGHEARELAGIQHRKMIAIERMYNRGAVGRSSPCPCGSEKKYKKCHGS